LYEAVESGAWAVNVFPICEQFPCTREEFRGSWEDRFDYDYVVDEYTKALKQGQIHTFNQELMLRIMSEEDRLILDTDIRWYMHDNVLSYRGRFNFYITTDFATSAKEAADFSVINVWAINNSGDWFWVDGVCRRQTMDQNINDLFQLAQEYRPQAVGIEVSGQQGGFIPWIQQEMGVRNNYFNLASDSNENSPGIRPTTNKMVRFQSVVPWFKAGKMYFPNEKKHDLVLLEIMDELRLASQSGFRSKHDDCIDTISMLPLLKAWKPSEETLMTKDGSGIWGVDDSDHNPSRLGSYTV
jgi:predicted phage terminase large subunit-like protein